MIRRQPIETLPNRDRWLVSYADFITLLFAFFVVMYSISHVNEGKYKVLAETFDRAFSQTDGDMDIDQRLLNVETENELSGVQTGELGSLESLEQALESALAGLIAEGDVSLSGNEQWIDIALNANILFESGRAETSEEAERVFSDVASVLAPFENAVAVSGYTDNVPISNALYKNNWELSSARSVAVVSILAFQGVSPERLSAVGYGEYRPIADNQTPEGRAKNRRVVLRVAKDAVALPEQDVAELFANELSQNGSESSVDGGTVNSDIQNGALADSNGVDDNNVDRNEAKVKPVKLRSGGLLFSSDPDLPRVNGVEEPDQ